MPLFDPSQPFVEEHPQFDPSQPFQEDSGVLNKNTTGETMNVAPNEKPLEQLGAMGGLKLLANKTGELANQAVEHTGAALLNIGPNIADLALKGLGLTGFLNDKDIAHFDTRVPMPGVPVPGLTKHITAAEQQWYQPGQPILEGKFADADIYPINKFLNNLIGGVTPGVVAASVAGAQVPALAIPATAYFLGSSVQGGMESANRMLDPRLTPFERRVAALDTLANSAMAGGIGAHVGQQGKVAPSGLGYNDIQPNFTTSDIDQFQGKIPPERQLQDVPPEARFAVSPAGQAADLSQLTPLEISALLRKTMGEEPTKKQYQPTYDLKQPIIEQPIISPYETQSRDITPAYQASGEAKQGGQVSFASEANARAIPNARQQAIEERIQNASTIRGNEGQSVEEGLQEKGGGAVGGSNLQRPSTEGVNPNGIELRSEGTGERGKRLKFYSNPLADPEFWKNTTQGVRDFITKAREEMNGFVLSGPRIAIDPRESGFKNPEKEVDAEQLYNRLRNKVPLAEWGYYKDVLPQEGKISPLEAAKVMQEYGPRVEVRKFGATTDAITASDVHKIAQLEHELDTRFPGWRADETAYRNDPNAQPLLREFHELEQKPGAPDQAAHWSSIAPKAEKDMLGYVEIAVVKPHEKPSVKEGQNVVTGSTFPQFPSSHSFPPNTLAFARGYMEHMPDGRKVFHVIEVQSDWAQQRRAAAESSRPDIAYPNPPNDPLLSLYERLALKAVIEHAKKEGAQAIAVQDAESVMMMEGVDRAVTHLPEEDLEPEKHVQNVIPQELGMRLHYDRTLPKIAEELTGSKGKRVEFGEHKMAVQQIPDRDASAPNRYEPRSDLIFRNADNTPKTSISARMYPIPKDAIAPTIFESDKPATRANRLYSNPVFDPDFWKRTGQDLAKTPQIVAEAKKKFQNWVDKAASEPRPLGWSPYWMATKEERAKAVLGNTPHRVLEDKEVGLGRQPGEPKPTGQALKEATAYVRNLVNRIDKTILVHDVFTDFLDNSKARFNGTLAQHVDWPIADNYQVELNLRKQHLDPLALVMKDEKLGKLNGERVGVAMDSLQEGGIERLKATGVTDATIKNINASLTSGEKRAMNVIKKSNDEIFPLIQAVAKKFGIEINKVDNYRSWQRDYQKYDAPPEKLALPEANKAATVDDVVKWITDSYPSRTSKPASGFTIERQKNAKTPIKLNAFETQDRFIRDAAHFIAMAEHLKDIGEIVRSEKFAAKYGKLAQDFELDYINTVARQGRSVNSIPLIDALRKRSSVGILAYRIASQVIHTVNIPFGLMRAGPEYWRRGMVASMTPNGIAWLKKNAGETFERGGGEPGIMELDTSELSTANAAKKFIAGAVKHGFTIQRFIDQKVAQATTIGVYQKLLAEKGKDASQWATLPVDKEVLAQARTLSRRAVASPLYKDTPKALNQGSITKLFLQFQNTFLDQWSNIRHDLPEYLQHDKTMAAKLAVAVVAMIAMESVIKLGIKSGLQKSVGYEPKQDDSLVKKSAEELFKRVPGGGQMMTALAYGGTGIPMVDLGLQAVKTGKNAVNSIQSGDTKGAKLAAVQAGTALGELAGVPGINQASEVVQDKMKAAYFKSHQGRVDVVADKLFGKHDNLTTSQRVQAEREYDKTKPRMSRQEEEAAGAQALKNNQKRGEALQSQLDKSQQEWLDKQGLRLPGHGDRVKVRGADVSLSKEELAQFEGYLKEEYSKRINMLQNPGFASLPASGKKSVFDAQSKAASESARARMAGQINQK